MINAVCSQCFVSGDAWSCVLSYHTSSGAVVLNIANVVSATRLAYTRKGNLALLQKFQTLRSANMEIVVVHAKFRYIYLRSAVYFRIYVTSYAVLVYFNYVYFSL